MNFQQGAAALSPASSAGVGVAQHGVVGGSGGMPFHHTIQQSFGHHDISEVRAVVGGPAAQATRSLGAAAYAVGESVAFSKEPDLHTAAHEAAHVVQQRGGVELAEGMGSARTDMEAHADEVADAVVAGESAEELLDAVAKPGAKRTGTARSVQLKAKKGGLVSSKRIPRKGKLAPSFDADGIRLALNEVLNSALFSGYGEATRKAARGLLLFVEKAAKQRHVGFTDLGEFRPLMVQLLDGLCADVAKNPSLAAVHSYVNQKFRDSLDVRSTGSRPSMAVVCVLVKQSLQKMASAKGASGNAVETTLKSRSELDRTATDIKKETGRKDLFQVQTWYETKVSGKLRRASQSLMVKVGDATVSLFQLMPEFKKVATVPHKIPAAKLETDETRRQLVDKVFKAWIKGRPPLPSGTLSIPVLGQAHTYRNDTISAAVLKFFAQGSTYAELNKYAGWAVLAGGLLSVVGYAFPAAHIAGRAISGIGTALVTAGTLYQLPSLVGEPLFRVIGGYRSVRGSDLLNAIGALAATAGALKVVGAAAKAAFPRLTIPTGVERSAIFQGTQKTAAGVLRIANPVADIYGVYLGSTAIYEKVRALRSRKYTSAEMGAALFALLGDIICVGSGLKGARTHAQGLRNAMNHRTNRRRFNSGLAVASARLARVQPGKNPSKVQRRKADSTAEAAIRRVLERTPAATFDSPSAARAATLAKLKSLGLKHRWPNRIVARLQGAFAKFGPAAKNPGEAMAQNRAAGGSHAPKPSRPGTGGPSGNGAKPSAPKSNGEKPSAPKSGKRAGGLNTNASVSNEPASTSRKAGKPTAAESAKAKLLQTVQTRFLASIDGLSRNATAHGKLSPIRLRNGRVWALGQNQPSAGVFPSKIATNEEVSRFFEAFRKTYLSQIVAKSPELATLKLPKLTFAGDFSAPAKRWRGVVLAKLASLDESTLRTLADRPLLDFSAPLVKYRYEWTGVRDQTNGYRDLIVSRGTERQKRELVFYLMIQPMSFQSAYAGCGSQVHRPNQPVPPKPTSVNADWPAPPPLNASMNATLHELWRGFASSDQNFARFKDIHRQFRPRHSK